MKDILKKWRRMKECTRCGELFDPGRNIADHLYEDGLLCPECANDDDRIALFVDTGSNLIHGSHTINNNTIITTGSGRIIF